MNNVVIAVLITAPVVFLLGSQYGVRKERRRRKSEDNYLRRVTQTERRAAARPGTTTSAVRKASLDRGSDLTGNLPYDIKRTTKN